MGPEPDNTPVNNPDTGSKATLKSQWADRQRTLGNTQRAVLFKNFPDSFNQSLHAAHVQFIQRHMPAAAASLLDVGCGFGRTSLPLKAAYPALSFTGVELSEEFARAYQERIGPCFCGSVSDFTTDERFDVITIITLLMYLSEDERDREVSRLGAMLKPGGRLIVIEPYFNFLTMMRRALKLRKLAPTGGEVRYFSRDELEHQLAAALPTFKRLETRLFGMPVTGLPRLHIGIAMAIPN